MPPVSLTSLTVPNVEDFETGASDPSDFGFLTQNFPTWGATGATILGTNGTVYVCKLKTPRQITVTNLHLAVTTAGATLTSGQNFAALYSSAKALLASTADLSTSWNSTGIKTHALTSAQVVPAGFFYVAFYANGTTRPTLARAANTNQVNGLLSNANGFWATAGTARTTSMPATLAAFNAFTTAYWAAVS